MLGIDGTLGEDVFAIVLVRDPRAVLSSRKDWLPPADFTEQEITANPIGFSPKKQVGFPYTQSIKALCIEHDYLRRLASSNRPNTILVEYESDLLNHPLDLLVRVYEKSGLGEVPPSVLEAVKGSVTGKCEHEGRPFSTCRSHLGAVDDAHAAPTLRDDKWKYNIDHEVFQRFLDIPECKNVVEANYPEPNESLHDDEL